MLVRLVGVCIAAALLFGCLFAKYFVLGEAINSGLMKPTNPLPGMICVGLAFAAPVYSAFCIGLLDARLRLRLLIGIVWFGIVMTALFLGNRAWPGHDSPTLFRSDFQFAIPVITFGWCATFLVFRWFYGWRLQLIQFDPTLDELTISSLLLITLLASLCISSLLFSRPGFQPFGLLGTLASTIIALLISPAIWVIMRYRFMVLSYCLIGTACFLVFYGIVFASGGGRKSASTAILATVFVQALLAGFAAVRLGGGRLVRLGRQSQDNNAMHAKPSM